MGSKRPSVSALLPPIPESPLSEQGPPPSYANAVSYPLYYPPACSQCPGNYPSYSVSYIGRQDVVLTTQPVQSPAPRRIHHNDYFGYSVFTMLFCCLPIGMGALVYSLEAQAAITRGDARAAVTHSKTSLILNHTALIVGLGIIVTSIIITIKILY